MRSAVFSSSTISEALVFPLTDTMKSSSSNFLPSSAPSLYLWKGPASTFCTCKPMPSKASCLIPQRRSEEDGPETSMSKEVAAPVASSFGSASVAADFGSAASATGFGSAAAASAAAGIDGASGGVASASTAGTGSGSGSAASTAGSWMSVAFSGCASMTIGARCGSSSCSPSSRMRPCVCLTSPSSPAASLQQQVANMMLWGRREAAAPP
mmetsp:Transcript_36569/g.105134  ORF Transcript_36569/g.105134 Transcript_36569/m.105134 type:complete len:211 (+) Transcript_36569:448-1080(+)